MNLFVLVGRLVEGRVRFHPVPSANGTDNSDGLGAGDFDVGGLGGERSGEERRGEGMALGEEVPIREHDRLRC